MATGLRCNIVSGRHASSCQASIISDSLAVQSIALPLYQYPSTAKRTRVVSGRSGPGPLHAKIRRGRGEDRSELAAASIAISVSGIFGMNAATRSPATMPWARRAGGGRRDLYVQLAVAEVSANFVFAPEHHCGSLRIWRRARGYAQSSFALWKPSRTGQPIRHPPRRYFPVIHERHRTTNTADQNSSRMPDRPLPKCLVRIRAALRWNADKPRKTAASVSWTHVPDQESRSGSRSA